MTVTPPDTPPADAQGPGISIQPPLIYAASMLAGIGLTGMCFHAIRARASRRARDVPDEQIRIHVEISERFSQRR